MKNEKKKLKHTKKGFTLVEVMAVLLILGLIAAIVAKNVMGKVDKAKVESTKNSLRVLHDAVNEFKLDTGDYPSEDGGLDELVNPPTDLEGVDPQGYLLTTEVPGDAWGNEFIYELNPDSGKPFVIISYGADGEEGGEGHDADLYSTDAY